MQVWSIVFMGKIRVTLGQAEILSLRLHWQTPPVFGLSQNSCEHSWASHVDGDIGVVSPFPQAAGHIWGWNTQAPRVGLCEEHHWPVEISLKGPVPWLWSTSWLPSFFQPNFLVLFYFSLFHVLLGYFSTSSELLFCPGTWLLSNKPLSLSFPLILCFLQAQHHVVA